MSTFIKEYRLATTRNITKNDIVNMCYFLKMKYDELYPDMDYNFEPEKISEGGIVFVNLPEKKRCKHAYKTMRFNRSDVWPWLSDNPKDEWSRCEDVLFHKNELLKIDLRCLYGASDFSDEELTIFEECFEKFNIKIIQIIESIKQTFIL